MSYRSRKHLPGKINEVVVSEEKRDKYLLAAANYNFLTVGKGKDLTEKQYHYLKATGGSIAVRQQAVVAVTDGTGRVGKPFGVYTSGIPGSPMRAVCDASKQERNLRYVMDTALELADCQNIKKVCGYFLTITIPNVDLDELETAFPELGKNGSRFVKSLYDANKRGNGAVLTGYFGDQVHVLGTLLKLETTVNKDCLKHHIGSGIFHPHLHLLILTDGPLNIPATKADLFKKWQERNPTLKLSPDAFKLESVYSHNDVELGAGGALRSAAVEAAKYTVKPDFYKNFAKNPSKFGAKVAAELLKATKHVHALRAAGLVALAQGYLALTRKQKGLYEASMAGGYMSNNQEQSLDDVYVPDIYTKLAVMRSGHLISERQLSDRELLGANRSLLEGAVLGNCQRLVWPDTKRGRLYKYLFEHTAFMKNRQDLENRLKLWAEARGYQYDRAFNAYQDALDAGDDEAIIDAKQALARLDEQINDLHRLQNALPDDLSKIQYTDLHRLGKLMAMFDKMQRLKCRIIWDQDKNTPRPVFGGSADANDDVEKVLCEMYLNNDLQTFRYLPPEICAAYETWRKTGKLYSDKGDEKAFSGVADVNWTVMQDVVADLAGKQNKAAFLQSLEPAEPAKPEPVDLDDIFAMTVAAM